MAEPGPVSRDDQHRGRRRGRGSNYSESHENRRFKFNSTIGTGLGPIFQVAETLLHGLRLIGDDAVVETILSAIEILEKKLAEKTPNLVAPGSQKPVVA